MLTLTPEKADQVAALLNERNELTVHYTRDAVLKDNDNYICRCSDSGDVIACVEVKSVQWYQCEILHLTVAKAHEGQGHAKLLLCEAERSARARRARILQCTIRDNNQRSRRLLEAAGFRRVGIFFNERSANNIGVFQKVLVPAQ